MPSSPLPRIVLLASRTDVLAAFAFDSPRVGPSDRDVMRARFLFAVFPFSKGPGTDDRGSRRGLPRIIHPRFAGPVWCQASHSTHFAHPLGAWYSVGYPSLLPRSESSGGDARSMKPCPSAYDPTDGPRPIRARGMPAEALTPASSPVALASHRGSPGPTSALAASEVVPKRSTSTAAPRYARPASLSVFLARSCFVLRWCEQIDHGPAI